MIMTCIDELLFPGRRSHVASSVRRIEEFALYTGSQHIWVIDQAVFRSRWLDIDQVRFFLRLYGPRRSRGP